MEDTSLQTVSIRQIKSLASVVDEYALGNDFLLGEMSMLKYPIRIDGYILFFLKSGRFKLDFNLNTYDMRQNSLLMVVPGNIIKLSAHEETDIADTQLYFMLASREFMSGIRFDFNKMFQESIRFWNNPCLVLKGENLVLAEDYFNLARSILLSRHGNKREILGALLTSFLHMAVGVWSARLSSSDAGQPENKSSARLNQIFERFIELVTIHHTTERGMAFYADKLCLTPKYLSKLVKQATGRSAPDWIDSFVILEAKNMLKYSDKTIKEIVFALHFPNQSVFYKFFKSHTGLTPSEYRKG